MNLLKDSILKRVKKIWSKWTFDRLSEHPNLVLNQPDCKILSIYTESVIFLLQLMLTASQPFPYSTEKSSTLSPLCPLTTYFKTNYSASAFCSSSCTIPTVSVCLDSSRASDA